MDCIKHYDFNKIDWSLDEIEKLDFKFIPTYKINPSFDSYHHSRYEGVIGNDVYFLPNPMPSFVDEILSLSIFDKYQIKTPGFHRLQPGMILPLHKDPYQSFKKRHVIFDTDNIHRYIIFMQDHLPGHYIQVENEMYMHYTKGCYVKWKGNTSHAAFNLGTENRYTLQITCYENNNTSFKE